MTILGKRWTFGIKQFKKIIIIGFQKVKILSTQNGVKIGEFPISEIGLMKECSRIRSKFVFDPKFFRAEIFPSHQVFFRAIFLFDQQHLFEQK